MRVYDVIKNNVPYLRVKIKGANPDDSTDVHYEDYFDGELGDIPKQFRECEVLVRRSTFGEINCLYIPYLPNVKQPTAEQRKKDEFVRNILLPLLKAVEPDVTNAKFEVICDRESVRVDSIDRQTGRDWHLRVTFDDDSLRTIAIAVLINLDKLSRRESG